jgi:osmotically-inducible protein OsmY
LRFSCSSPRRSSLHRACQSIRAAHAKVRTAHAKVRTAHAKVFKEVKEAASKRIAKLDGVERVDKILEILSPELESRFAATDDVIKKSAQASLENAPDLAKSDITIFSADNGVVMLCGRTTDIGQHVTPWSTASRGAERRGQPEARKPSSGHDLLLPNQSQDSQRATLKDAWTTTQLKMRLIGNENVPSMAMRVDTYGTTVSLSGVVPSDTAKHEAEQETMKVKGVKKFDNTLGVDTKLAESDRVEDRDIEASIRRMSSSEDIDGIKFAVNDGVVR